MRLLNDALCELVQKGLVDPHEAYLKAVEKESLVAQFQHMGVKLDPAQIGDTEGGEGGGHAASSHSTSSHGTSAPASAATSAPSSSTSHAASGGPAPLPPFPKKPSAAVDPALEEFRKKRGY
jgi:hypothetical protein